MKYELTEYCVSTEGRIYHRKRKWANGEPMKWDSFEDADEFGKSRLLDSDNVIDYSIQSLPSSFQN